MENLLSIKSDMSNGKVTLFGRFSWATNFDICR